MTPKFKKQWIEALRSGKYKQCRGAWVNNFDNPTQFCCLTVGLIEAGKWSETLMRWRNEPILDTVVEILGVELKTVKILADMNDNAENISFSEIADWIEAQDTL